MEKQRSLAAVIINEKNMTDYSRTIYPIRKTFLANNIDSVIVTSFCDINDSRYLQAQSSVLGIIDPVLIDGLIVFADTVPEGYADSLISEARALGKPVIITAAAASADSAAELAGLLTGKNIPAETEAPPARELPDIRKICTETVMSEDLMNAENFRDCLCRLGSYSGFIGKNDRLYICLNENIMNDPAPDSKLSDKLITEFSIVFGDIICDKKDSFSKDDIFSGIWEKRAVPEMFIISPLHFLEISYGFSVLTLDKYKPVHSCSPLWLRYVAAALEQQRRNTLFNNAVVDTQIRDSLTGLMNMRGYIRLFTERAGRFDNPDRLLHIISLDVENLRGINDTYGYEEGNRVLSRLGIIISNAAGENDVCVRVGGDEFFIARIISPEDNRTDIIAAVKNGVNLFNSGSGRQYGINIFIADAAAPLTSPSILETLPYEAAYQRTMVKNSSSKLHKTKNTSEGFDAEERNNVIHLLNENLFTYHFQPIVSARDGSIIAYEALMRSGTKYRISPLAILNHAQALGRTYEIEKYTLMNTFEYLKENIGTLGSKQLFINCIPACILTDEDFEKLYKRYGSIMRNVVIEFTEQTEADGEQLRTLLARSRRAGFKIAVDDYGTGYSNISNLLNFMPHVVKIDRSLIMNIHNDSRKQHFTKNIIDYAHDNSFKVLAEGVELKEELRTVIAMGIDYIQGFYTARPAEKPIPEIEYKIAEYIRRCNLQLTDTRVRKTYFTGDESEISLMALDCDGYTDILITKESYRIIGNRSYQSETVIRTKDGLDCRLELADACIKDDYGTGCITVGNMGTLTLDVVGNVSLMGEISVPESAAIKIVGNGSLSIKSSSGLSYAIGSAYSSSYGNIGIYLKNRLYIHMDNERSVAIGGGLNKHNSVIDIEADEMIIEQTGKSGVGIGTVSGKANVNIRNTNLSIDIHGNSCIGIGSTDDSINVMIENSKIDVHSSGDRIAAVCSMGSDDAVVNMRDTQFFTELKGKSLIGIGADMGEVKISIVKCRIDALCEGGEATAMGSMSRLGIITLMESAGRIAVNSGKGCIYSVEEQNLLCQSNEIITSIN